MDSLIQLGCGRTSAPLPAPVGDGLRIYLTALGCRVNEAEQQTWARAFARAGHAVARSPEQADVLVLNTCAVTVEAARKSRRLCRRLHRRNPRALVVVTGCWADLEPEAARLLEGVDLVLPNRDKDRLPALLLERLDPGAAPLLGAEPDACHPRPSTVAGARTRAFVKVQDGCRHRCSYCIVTVARGAERSRPIEEVAGEIRALGRAGYQEAVLTGIHLGGYGDDVGSDLGRLIEHLLAHTGIARLRVSSLEPWNLAPGFFDLWRDRRLCPHLHLPLQSGCDRTLRRMARRTTSAEYADLVARARDAIADLTVTTDLIVGFPGESDADFDESLAFVERMDFAHVHVFPFSPRLGTAAAAMPDRVPADTRRARVRRAIEVATAGTRRHLLAAVGTTREVLWQPTGEAGCFEGYTDNYLPAYVRAPDDLGGVVASLRIERAGEDGRLHGLLHRPCNDPPVGDPVRAAVDLTR